MTAWHLLVPFFALCCVCSAMSYSKLARDWPGYTWAMCGAGAVCAWMFALAARWLDDKEAIYVYSLWWDSLMLAAYYLLPLLASGVRPAAGACAGVVLVVLGMALVKLYS